MLFSCYNKFVPFCLHCLKVSAALTCEILSAFLFMQFKNIFRKTSGIIRRTSGKRTSRYVKAIDKKYRVLQNKRISTQIKKSTPYLMPRNADYNVKMRSYPVTKLSNAVIFFMKSSQSPGHAKTLSFPVYEIRPRGYKNFTLNSAEHEILPAHEC